MELISNDLTQIINFPTWISDCSSDNPALLDLFVYSDALAFPPLWNSDHVVVWVSIEFPSNLKRDVPFHHIIYDYSRADWDGLCDHLRDAPWNDILMLLLLIVNFASGFMLELMYISLIVSIRLSLILLHGFLLLALLPYFTEITFFVCTNRISLK